MAPRCVEWYRSATESTNPKNCPRGPRPPRPFGAGGHEGFVPEGCLSVELRQPMSASEGPAFVQSPMGQAVMQQRTTHGEQQPAPVLSSEVPGAPHPMVPYVSSMPIASAPAVMGAAVSAMPPVCMPSVMPAPTPVVVAVEVTQGHPAGMVPAGIVGDRRAARRANGAPLTAEEALAQARAEGLTLHTATNTKTGYKGAPPHAAPAAPVTGAPYAPGRVCVLPPPRACRREPRRQVGQEAVPGGAGHQQPGVLCHRGGGGAGVCAPAG